MSDLNANEWNSHWTKELQNDNGYRAWEACHEAGKFLQYLDVLRERNARHILLAGNGRALLPYALVHCGFEVTVVDFSSVVNESVAAVEPTAQQLALMLPVYEEVREGKMLVGHWNHEASLSRVTEEAKEGGSLTFVTGDILEWEPNTPIDVIYDDRMAMLFSDDARYALAQRYFRWVSESSLLVLHTVNLGRAIGRMHPGEQAQFEAVFAEFETAFIEAGFQPCELQRRETRRIPAGPAPPSPVQRLVRWISGRSQEPPIVTPLQEEPPIVTPLPEGKLVFFLHGSG